MPTFLVIGAMKAGTTALYSFMRQHPDVFMPEVKEPHYFALAGQQPRFRGPDADRNMNRAVTTRRGYERLFKDASGRKAVGEASPSSLYFPGAPERIKEEIPHVRMIAILRQPADRAYSAYLHLRRDGYERARDFAEALRLEPARFEANWGLTWRYRDVGFYGAQLSRFYRLFPPDQIRVYLYEELSTDPLGVIRDAYAFIGVDPTFVPDVSHRHNVSGVPQDPIAASFFGLQFPMRSRLATLIPRHARERIRRSLSERLVRMPLDPALRAQLTGEFSGDIGLLSALTGRDLTAWSSERPPG